MYFETWITTDQRKLPETIALHGNVFTQDNMANLIGVVLKNDGANVDIDGSVVGYAIRADKNTVIINGEKEGNRAWVILPEAAYAYPGPLSVVIRVVNGEDKTVIGACSGYVTRSISGSPVDPGHVIPDITELLAMIEECEEAAGNANTAAALANQAAAAATEAAESAEQAATGAVKYSEAQTLTAAQQAQARANIGAGDAEEVADLKSAMSEYVPKNINGLYLNGSYVMTAETSTDYSKIFVLPIKPQHKYLFWCNTGNRWAVGLGDIYDVYPGYECEVKIDRSSSFVGAVVINNSNSKKFAYVYYYNGDTDPNAIYELIDITELNPSDLVTFKGVWVTSNGVRPPAYDVETISIPLVPNKDYTFKVWGGNRRNIALGSKQFPEVGDTITLISGGTSTSSTTIAFNSGNYTYLYAYYLATGSAQDYPARFELIPDDGGLIQIYRYTDYHTTSTVANTGGTFVVGEYNVAKYNNDTTVFISSEKLHNLKSVIAEINADVLIIDEDLGYIDANNTKSSLDYVFMPVYPYQVGSAREKIYSKVPFTSSQNKTSPNSRPVTFATINRNAKTILVVCVHAKPGITAADVTARQEDLTWLIGEINNMTFDYLIMGGDFNPEAGDDDLTIMESAFSNANMLMCNGGRFDYLNTWFDPSGKYSDVVARQMPLDYVITSNNIICNSFRVYSDKFFDLYSDHVPIMANLTLLET